MGIIRGPSGAYALRCRQGARIPRRRTRRHVAHPGRTRRDRPGRTTVGVTVGTRGPIPPRNRPQSQRRHPPSVLARLTEACREIGLRRSCHRRCVPSVSCSSWHSHGRCTFRLPGRRRRWPQRLPLRRSRSGTDVGQPRRSRRQSPWPPAWSYSRLGPPSKHPGSSDSISTKSPGPSSKSPRSGPPQMASPTGGPGDPRLCSARRSSSPARRSRQRSCSTWTHSMCDSSAGGSCSKSQRLAPSGRHPLGAGMIASSYRLRHR